MHWFWMVNCEEMRGLELKAVVEEEEASGVEVAAGQQYLASVSVEHHLNDEYHYFLDVVCILLDENHLHSRSVMVWALEVNSGSVPSFEETEAQLTA